MDLSEGHATASKLAAATTTTSSHVAANNSKSNETSLEMIKLSLTPSSGQSEDRVDPTEAGVDVGTNDVTVNNSMSDQTLGPELPSLPTDQFDESEPVSLSQIHLEEN